jgi:hypothetical protein
VRRFSIKRSLSRAGTRVLFYYHSMRCRPLLKILVAVLVFQGNLTQAAVSAMESHLTVGIGHSDHDLDRANCPCCPDQGKSASDCTQQCFGYALTVTVVVPSFLSRLSQAAVLAELSSTTRYYAPLDPPPIA